MAASAPGPLLTGTTENLTATLRDATATPIGNFPVKLTIAGANPAVAIAITNASGVAAFSYSGTRPGTDQIHATVLAPTFQIDSAVVSVVWTQAPTTGPALTQGWIASPAHGSAVTGRVPIVLSNTVTLTTGTVSYYSPATPADVHLLAANVSGAPGATLATLDTTVLANGTYIIELDGTDSAGNQKTSLVLVTAADDYKPGRVVVELTDFTVPIAGLPITIGRRYDSLEKDKVGDFGHGWSLTYGTKLEVDPAHGVTLTLPTGRRATFNFAPTFPVVNGGPVAIILGLFLLPAYAPPPGVFGTLTSDGCSLIYFNPFLDAPTLNCLEHLFEPEQLQYAPTEYTYTDPYGTKYVMGATGEIRLIADRQGNTLSFQPNGIISSTGKSLTFVRDAQ